MNILRSIACLLMAVLTVSTSQAQNSKAGNQRPAIGQMSLIPYLPGDYPQQAETLLLNKLTQAVAQSGLAGAGFDDRFVITAHVMAINTETTATIPQRTAVRLGLTIYVGDGLDGTLFSQYYCELKGVGSNENQAWLNALRRLQPQSSEVQACIAQGKQRIIDYYDTMSASIIEKAKTLAKSRQYDQAITTLLSLPAESKAYGEAQRLIAQYGQPALDNANQTLLNQARAAWSSHPDDDGAADARALLARISYPTAAVDQEIKALTQQMSDALQQQYERQWQLLEQERQNWHERELKRIEGENAKQVARIESEGQARVASIIAAAEVEKAWINRPRVVYHVNWW